MEAPRVRLRSSVSDAVGGRLIVASKVARLVVAGPDIAVQFAALIGDIFALQRRGRRPQMHGRGAVNAARRQTQMRDLRGVRTKVMTQLPVLHVRPRGAQLRDEAGVVPIAVLAPETGAIDTASRDHDVGVEIALVALLAGPVHGDVGDHALGDQVLARKGADQVPALIKIKFVRQRQEASWAGMASLRRPAASTAFHRAARSL